MLKIENGSRIWELIKAYLIKRELYWLDTEQEIEAHNGQRLEEVIKKRFGFIGSEEGRSLEDIGNDYGLTRERIRQLELKSIKRLRWKKDLRDYVGI